MANFPNPAVSYSTVQTDKVVATVAPPNTGNYGGMFILPADGTARVFEQKVELSGKGTVTIHLGLDGIYRRETVEFNRTITMTYNSFSDECGTVPNPVPAPVITSETATAERDVAGSVTINACFLARKKSSDPYEIVALGTRTFSGFNDAFLTRNFTIPFDYWEAAPTETNLSPTCQWFFEAPESVVRDCLFRIWRVDSNTSTPVYFQGLSLSITPIPETPVPTANVKTAFEATAPVMVTPPAPMTLADVGRPAINIDDDGVFPQMAPYGQYGSSFCEKPVDPTDPTEPTDPPPDPPPPTTTDPGDCMIVCLFPSDMINISVASPSTRVYAKGQAVNLPSLTIVGDTDNDCYASIVHTGSGFLATTVDPLPAGVDVGYSADNKQFAARGTKAAVNTVIGSLKYVPTANEVATIGVSARAQDGKGRKGVACTTIKLVSNGATQSYESSSITCSLTGNTGSILVMVQDRPIHASPVNWAGSMEATTQALVSAINGYAGTFSFDAEVNTDGSFTIFAPSRWGDEADSFVMDADTTGTLALNCAGQSFSGGVKGNRPDDNFWDTLWDLADPSLSLISLALPWLLNDDDDDEKEVPQVCVKFKGRVVKVPSNFNTDSRTYNGEWDRETWKDSWTDCPAWCALDYMENRDYGCGNDIRLDDENRAKVLDDLYRLSVYAAQPVPAPGGGVEPRYSIGTIITGMERREILDAILSTMNASLIEPRGEIRIVADIPGTPVLSVNNSNVVGGRFRYSSSSMRTTMNKVECTWNDPANFDRTTVVTIDDAASQARLGVKSVRKSRFGCRRKGEAIRYGRYLMLTEERNPIQVAFAGDWSFRSIIPNDIIVIEDNTTGMGGTLYRVTRWAETSTLGIFDIVAEKYDASKYDAVDGIG